MVYARRVVGSNRMIPRKTRSETVPLSQTSRQLMGSLEAGGPAVVLAAYHRDGSNVVTMQADQPVVVGREAPADLVIGDRSLSRRHARFSLEGGLLRVEDLGSTNGTRVRGEIVTSAAFRPGEPVYLGQVLVTAYVRAASEPALAALRSHEQFMSALSQELTRAKFFNQPASVLMINVVGQDGAGAHVGGWSQRVAAALRPIDVIGLYSHDTLEVLLPQTELDSAKRIGVEAVKAAARNQSVRCGVAAFPASAATAEALLDVCRRALGAANPEQPVALAADKGALSLGAVASDDGIVFESAAMKQLMTTIERVANATLPVLLLGETGTGKEVIAGAIHSRGPRSGKPLVGVNCGAIPAQLVESTLFGHVRGAFTGAESDSKGVFGAADGGTVLLDEIGELPPAAQVSLLRALETGRITRVGSAEERAVDVRVIAATHRDLETMCDEGQFRRDLLYRINALTLHIPPLRERIEEIEPLVSRFLASSARPGTVVAPDAMQALKRYVWPGNIRELRNVVERATVVAQGDRIALEDLPERVRGLAPSSLPPASEELLSDDDLLDLKSRVRRYEARLIVQALRDNHGNQTHAARQLQIPLRTLVHKLKVLQIDKDAYLG